MSALPAYEYTSLGSLPETGRVNVYGVVRNVTALDNGGFVVKVEDEVASAIIRFVRKSNTFAEDLRVNDILRVHRAEVGFYRNEKALVVEVGSFGCHAVSWRGDFDAPLQLTSITCTMSKQDSARLHTLRRWLRTKTTSVHPSSDHLPEPLSNGIPAEASNQRVFPSSLVKSTNETAPQTTRLCPTISSAMEIPTLGAKFFNWYAQVLGVYRAKGDAFTVFLRVWDGTKPKFAAYRNMFHAGSDSIETTYCEIQQFLLHVVEDYVIDVCCYGDWARKAMELKVGDIVFLGNIRNYVCHSNKLSAVTLHDGGARFNRALNTVNESDSNYFKVSKRCADTLSLYCGANSTLLATPIGDELTPLFSEEPQARSTPKASPNPVNVVKGKETALVDGCNAAANISLPRNTFVINSESRGKSATPVATESSPRKRRRRSIVEGERVTTEEVAVTGEFSEWLDARQGPSRAEANTTEPQILPRNSSSSSDLAGISSPCIAQTEDQIRNQVLNSEEDSIVEGETVIVDQHLEEICGNSVFPLEILRFLDDLVRRNLPKSDEVLRIAAFHNKIKQKLLQTLFEKKLAELDGTETGGIELVEEMEEILKMNVGDHVDFVNFVEAELSVLKQPDYLRNALLFTGKCVSCGEEVIVERRSKHWCRKCFTEKNELSSIRYSYRILVPSVYLRSDGQLAQLCLAIAGDIWASLSTGSDRLSVNKVVELYSEEIFETFIRKLNHVILLAEAIMKKQKFSVIDGKIIALNRSSGSISMFVDRCMIAKREC